MVEPRYELRPQKSEPTCLITVLTATLLPNKWRKIWVGEVTLRVEDLDILNTFLKKYTTTNTDKNCSQWSNLLVLYIVLSINFLLSTRQCCKISTIPIFNTEKLKLKDHKWLPKVTLSARVEIKTIFVCEEKQRYSWCNFTHFLKTETRIVKDH